MQSKGFGALRAKQVQDFERIVVQNLASSSARVLYGRSIRAITYR
ncbi:hypothetical protein [Microcystis aeruginosa]|nr:hypothetical protein [Microcystis aeruginosa]